LIELDCISNSKARRSGPSEVFGTVFGIVLSVTLGAVATTNFPFYSPKTFSCTVPAVLASYFI